MAKDKDKDPEQPRLEKPGPPPKPPRGFPFRLLLWAIITTASTGALAYFAFRYRDQGLKDHGDLAVCNADLTKVTGERDGTATKLTSCSEDLTAATATATELGGQLTKVSGEKATAEERRKAAEKIVAETRARLEAIAEIQEQFAKMVDTGQLTLKPRRGMLVVGVDAEVLFPSASAQLSEKGELAVLEVGLILKGLKRRPEDRHFLVVGHTDSQVLKSTKYDDNLELSTARALTVTRFLIKAGMTPASLIAGGAGDSDPIGDNGTDEGRKRNRRIEIVVLPAVTELPPLPTSLEDEPAPAPAPEPTP